MSLVNIKRMEAAADAVLNAYRRLWADGDEFGLCDDLDQVHSAIRVELEAAIKHQAAANNGDVKLHRYAGSFGGAA